MKIAVIGSRSLKVENLGEYLPTYCTEIVSGGANGIDKCAAEFARKNNIKLTEILPEYARYGKGAPLVRNKTIVDTADEVIAFWDENSRGTLNVIKYAQKIGKPLRIINMK